MEKTNREKNRAGYRQPDPESDSSRPDLFLPDPMNGEGFKLPLPPAAGFVGGLTFDPDGSSFGLPPGDGSGNRGPGLDTHHFQERLESECSVCDGRKLISAFVKSSRGWDELRCPMCLGKGTLGALRKLTHREHTEIVALLGRLAFNVDTPLIAEKGQSTSIFVRRLETVSSLEMKIREGLEIHFLLAAVSNRPDRAKLDFGLSYEIGVLASLELVTTQLMRSGDVVLQIGGLKNSFEPLRVEATRRTVDLIDIHPKAAYLSRTQQVRKRKNRFRDLFRSISRADSWPWSSKKGHAQVVKLKVNYELDNDKEGRGEGH